MDERQNRYPTREVVVRKTKVMLPRKVTAEELGVLVGQVTEYLALSGMPPELIGDHIEIEAGVGEILVSYSETVEDDLHAQNHVCGDKGVVYKGAFLTCTMSQGHLLDHMDEEYPEITWRRQ